MPAGRRRFAEPDEIFIRDFLGGLQTRIHETRIADNSYASATNTRLSEDGILGKRLGSDYFGSAISLGSAIRTLGVASYYAGATKKFLAGSGIRLLEKVNGQYTTITGANFTLNQPMNFVQARGNVYIHNASDLLTKYDGIALTRLAASGSLATAASSVTAGGIVAGFGIFFKSSHVAGGNPTYQSRTFVSQAGNSDNFVLQNVDNNSTDQAEWYDVAKDDGDVLMGFGNSGDSLIVFKERAIYEARYNTSIAATSGGASGTLHFFSSILPINKGIGTVSHRTIDAVENDIAFLSREGVYLLGQQAQLSGLRLAEISQPVRNILEGISTANLSKCAAIYFNKRYYLSIPYGSTSVNNRILVFNREYGVWEGFWDGQNINSFTTFIGTDGSEQLYFADDNSPRVGQLESNSYTDFSNAINTDIYLKNFDLNAPERFKRWQDVTVQFKDTVADITLRVYVDGVLKKTSTFTVGAPSGSVGIGSGIISTGVIGNNGNPAITQDTTTDRRLKINAKGRNCQIRVTNATPGQRFNLMSIKVTYRNSYGHSSYPSANKVTGV